MINRLIKTELSGYGDKSKSSPKCGADDCYCDVGMIKVSSAGVLELFLTGNNVWLVYRVVKLNQKKRISPKLRRGGDTKTTSQKGKE